jgi:hypothetical protein
MLANGIPNMSIVPSRIEVDVTPTSEAGDPSLPGAAAVRAATGARASRAAGAASAPRRGRAGVIVLARVGIELLATATAARDMVSELGAGVPLLAGRAGATGVAGPTGAAAAGGSVSACPAGRCAWVACSEPAVQEDSSSATDVVVRTKVDSFDGNGAPGSVDPLGRGRAPRPGWMGFLPVDDLDRRPGPRAAASARRGIRSTPGEVCSGARRRG